ncbi:ABC transporter ATP-binding protein [Candidatus Woesearchaeota archaeon]|nr:ABC transporter ATP-binding protein [Candidatus Woesearchaeota archaeon]
MSKTKKSILKLANVWKSYNMGKAGILTVLKKINLDVKQGEFVAIAGPSGSGKSTMMNIVGALDIPTQGSIYLKNKSISDMSESSLAELRGETIGFIFQQFNLIPTLSALQNVMLPMEFINKPTSFAKKRAEYLLKTLGLADRMHHKPTELSGGQQQRVAIARSLANDPEIILADEPTGNLDSEAGKFIMNFLNTLNKKHGKTVILITHDVHLIKNAKKIIYLKDGMIIKTKGDKK